MDFIKKKICIEGSRTRTQGLMPYYEFGKKYESKSSYGDSKTVQCYSPNEIGLEIADGDNGNWGQFVANPCFLSEKFKTYQGMMYAYYAILNIVRNGKKLRKVETKEKKIVYVEDLGAFSWNEHCPSDSTKKGFSEITEPDFLYGNEDVTMDYAAYPSNDFYSFELDSKNDGLRKVYRYSTEKIPLVEYPNFIVLVKDYDKFLTLASYLDGTNYSVISDITIENGDEHLKWSRYCQVVDKCIGKINVPSWIYNKHIKTPKVIPCADVKPYIDWLESHRNDLSDCCNKRLWDDMGGDDFLGFLENTAQAECEEISIALNGLKYSIPYIEMPVLLTQNYTDIGVLSNIDGTEYDIEKPGPVVSDESRPHGRMTPDSEDESGLTEYDIAALSESGFGVTMGEIFMESAITSFSTDGEDSITVESLLNTLRSDKKFMDDMDNVLPGLFKRFENKPEGKMFVCVKGASEGEWTMTSLDDFSPNQCKNGDGLSSDSEGIKYPSTDSTGTPVNKFYRTITTESSGIRIAQTEEEETGIQDGEGTHYFFCVKYDNSEENPMSIPFKSGNVANMYAVQNDVIDNENDKPTLYRGDFILPGYPLIDSDKNEIIINYVVGGFFKTDENGKFESYVGSGDVYSEKYSYDPKHVDYVALDGVNNVPVWSEYIDFVGAEKEFYSPRYNLFRTGNTANIIEMTSGDQWAKKSGGDGNIYSYDAYLAKEEYLTNFSLPPKTDVNVTIDRGGVSVFEKHYKLSECNTMQDLENYSNGYFFE